MGEFDSSKISDPKDTFFRCRIPLTSEMGFLIS